MKIELNDDYDKSGQYLREIYGSINPLIHMPLSKDISSAGSPHVPG